MPIIPAGSLHGERPHPARLTPAAVVAALAPILSPSRQRRIEEVLRRRLVSVTVVLENLYDPHNGAAVLRTCEALGLLHVHVIEGAEPFFFSRKVSRRAHKWLNVYLHRSAADCLEQLRASGFVCWAAVPPPVGNGGKVVEPTRSEPEVEAGSKVALLFGNEHVGLSERALALADRCFSIPLPGFTASLNLSVSVAMALHPVVARRRRQLGQDGDLGGEARERVRAACYALSAPRAAEILHRALRPGR